MDIECTRIVSDACSLKETSSRFRRLSTLNLDVLKQELHYHYCHYPPLLLANLGQGGGSPDYNMKETHNGGIEND